MIRPMIFCMAISLLTGCGILTPRQVTQQDKEKIVFDAARAGTSIAIAEINKDSEKRTVAANHALSYVGKALEALSDPNEPPTREIQDQIFSGVPAQYRALMAVALDTFNTYYEVPAIGKVLNANQIGVLTAFLNGVQAGATDILNANK